MERQKYVSEKTLARYAAVLGHNSLAADTLRQYRANPSRYRIVMHNNGFRLVTK